MARKLKTYQTSMGFFDLAIAAPSMKAALEAWGSKSNLFHQGLANEVDDPEVVAATISKPGVVMKRPVGSAGAFKEQSELPTDLTGKNRSGKGSAKRSPRKGRHLAIDEASARKAALDYEREQRKRESERRKEDAERIRREHAIAKAEAALEEARINHEETVREMEIERTALEKRSRTEDARWEKQKEKLDNALRRAKR
ncbi:cell envelope biogenesis protein TolA [Bradyrhizobium sp. SYSU BS000235]|uniref:cell envelope biogenesis protein TolA n=1 Tax=Bradyrhizobium sp. SYSU BS000235 TaxID=3411332 RepID=UPI003C74C959